MRAALLFTGLAAAAVEIAAAADELTQDSRPDCKNGPISTNKICDPSASKHSAINNQSPLLTCLA